MSVNIKPLNIFNLMACASLEIVALRTTDNMPVTIGSGFLVHYKKRVFLVSVAHVTEAEGTQTCIGTNQPPHNGHSVLYGLKFMCYFERYRLANELNKNAEAFEDLKLNFEERLDITFGELKENVSLLQPEWDMGAFQIDAGDKVMLNLEQAGDPVPGKLFGFCGRIKQDLDENAKILHSEVTFKLDLTYRRTSGPFHIFLTPRIIKNKSDFEGCSGAPIFDEDGMLVGVVQSVGVPSQMLFAFSISEVKTLLDQAIQTKFI